MEELRCIESCDTYGLKSVRRNPDIVYNLGAHIGEFTLVVNRRFPQARVIAIEPHPSNFRLLQRNTGHLDNLVCLPYALGSGVVKTNEYIKEGGPQVLGFNTEARFGKGLLLGHTAKVETITLERLVKEYPGTDALWKIDVEGEEEAFILGSMSDAPLRRALYIAIEIHVDITKAILDSRGSKINQWVQSFKKTHKVRHNPNDNRIVQFHRR